MIVKFQQTSQKYLDVYMDDGFIAFIVNKGNRYGFVPLATQFASLKDAANSLYANKGLTLTEAKERATILAGIYRAAQALKVLEDKEEVSA